MAILTQLACLAVTLAPQQPGLPATTTTSAVEAPPRIAGALPESTLLVAHLSELAPHRAVLSNTPLAHILEELPLPEQAEAHLEHLCARTSEITGLDRDRLAEMFEHGVTLAITDTDEAGHPIIVLAAELENAIDYRIALERAGRDIGASSREHTGTRIWTIALPDDMQLDVCVHGDHLLMASDGDTLQSIVDGLDQPHARSLATNAAYSDFVADPDGNGIRLVRCFARTDLLVQRALAAIDGEMAGKIKSVVKALRPEQIGSVGFTMSLDQGTFEDHLRVAFAEPRTGLLAALLGPTDALSPESVAVVPPGVSSFTIAQMDLNAIFEEVLDLIDLVDANVGQQVRGGIAAMGQKTGSDLQQDLLGSIGNRFATLQWPSTDGATHMAVVVDINETFRLERALTQLMAMAGSPAKARTWRSHSIYGTGQAGSPMSLSFSINDKHLVFASSENAMRSTLSHLDEPTANESAMHVVSRIPPGATAITWTSIRPTIDGFLDQADRMGLGTHELRSAFERGLEGVDGDMDSFVTVDPQGVSVRTRSATGNLYALGGAFIATSMLMPTFVSGPTLSSPVSWVQPSDDVKLLVSTIAEAEQTAKQASGQYMSLRQLIQNRHLTSGRLGAPNAQGFHERGDYLVTVLLPEDTAARSSFFAVVAWPRHQRRGWVLAATETEPLLVNQAIAAAEGISKFAPTDLFLSGRFGTPFAPGWRSLDRTRATDLTQIQPRDQELMQAVVNAKNAGKTPVPLEVLEALASANPQVAGYAAWTLGELKASENVPQLCETAASHSSVFVQQHALAALLEMRDQRSIKTAIEALHSDDRMVRALAAQILGRLKATNGADGLLAVAGGEPSDDERDRVAALLALTDLGQAKALLPASAAITTEQGVIAQAITYMFQTLSPTLEPKEEARVLMAVLGHPCQMLRRYSIQRLGQLRHPSSVPALEGRLAKEDDVGLRKLVEVSLDAVRGHAASDNVDTSADAGESMFGSILTKLADLSTQQRSMAAGGIAGFVLIVSVFLLMRSRKRRKADAEHWASFAAPSEGFGASDHYADGDYDPEAPGIYDDSYEQETAGRY